MKSKKYKVCDRDRCQVAARKIQVDIAYGVEYPSQLAGETATVDLAIASDRENDTLAILAINSNGGGNNGLPGNEILTDVTSVDIPDTIFGVDDGEATA